MIFDSLLGRAASVVDRAFVAATQERRPRGARGAASMSHAERLARLGEIRDAYRGADPDDFFAPPPPVTPTLRHVRARPDGGQVLDASWPSGVVPYLDGFRERYLAHGENRTAHARLHLGKTARPAVILIHGYLGGRWSIEERTWPFEWMLRRGLDVAFTLLPFHALRAAPQGSPRFPGDDPRLTIEGFRQAVADVHSLIGILRARGAPSVGVMGMSLGGYTTSLLATVERDLAFAVPIIPLSAVADYARDHGRLSPGAEGAREHAAIEEAHALISPLSRPSRVAPERMLVVGARADRITPIAQAQRVARHFGAPFHELPGSHLVQLGRGEAFRAVRRMWQRLGLVA